MPAVHRRLRRPAGRRVKRAARGRGRRLPAQPGSGVVAPTEESGGCDLRGADSVRSSYLPPPPRPPARSRPSFRGQHRHPQFVGGSRRELPFPQQVARRCWSAWFGVDRGIGRPLPARNRPGTPRRHRPGPAEWGRERDARDGPGLAARMGGARGRRDPGDLVAPHGGRCPCPHRRGDRAARRGRRRGAGAAPRRDGDRVPRRRCLLDAAGADPAGPSPPPVQGCRRDAPYRPEDGDSSTALCGRWTSASATVAANSPSTRPGPTSETEPPLVSPQAGPETRSKSRPAYAQCRSRRPLAHHWVPGHQVRATCRQC